MSIMGAPRNVRLPADFEEWFPQGLYLVGEIHEVTEYQSQEDRARNRPARPRIDEVTGLRLYRGTFADPAAEKEREKSVTVEFACAHQPVPPAAIAGLPFRPAVLDGMTVAPRAEASGQAKWITWIIRATGMRAPGGNSAESSALGKPSSGRSAVGPGDAAGRTAA
jgi:hypothetical protein